MEPTGTEFENLAKRVAGLERQNRWMKRAGCAGLVFLALALLVSQARHPQTVRANNFTLVDSNGRLQAELSSDADGIPSLSFYDANKDPNVVLLGGEVPGLVVGTDGHPMADLRAPSFGKDPQGKNTGSAALKLFDAEGKLRVELGAFHGGPSLDIGDADGYCAILGARETKAIHTGETQKTSAASMELFGKDNELLWSAP